MTFTDENIEKIVKGLLHWTSYRKRILSKFVKFLLLGIIRAFFVAADFIFAFLGFASSLASRLMPASSRGNLVTIRRRTSKAWTTK